MKTTFVLRAAAVAALLGVPLLVYAMPQDKLLEQELGNCDVDTAPFSERTPRAFIYNEPLDQASPAKEGAKFTIDITHSAILKINSYDNSSTAKTLNAGKAWTLEFARDANNKFDVEIFEGGTSVDTWADRVPIGTYDPLGMFSAGFEHVLHPGSLTNKKCIRVWFQRWGLRYGFLMYDA